MTCLQDGCGSATLGAKPMTLIEKIMTVIDLLKKCGWVSSFLYCLKTSGIETLQKN